MKKYWLLIFCILIIAASCGGKSGRIHTLPREQQPITSQNLTQSRENYHVSYLAGRAIIFALPGNDFQLLLSGQWRQIKDNQSWIDLIDRYGAIDTWRRTMTGWRGIYDPAGNLYGYINHPLKDATNVRVIDERTLRLFYHIARTPGV